MFNLSLQKWMLILGLLVLTLMTGSGILTYKLIQERERSKALEMSVKVYENDMRALREKNFSLIDSLEKVRKVKDEDIAHRDKTIEEMLTFIDSIIQNIPHHEEAIDSMHDLDSINRTFTRYYPDNTAPGEGGH